MRCSPALLSAGRSQRVLEQGFFDEALAIDRQHRDGMTARAQSGGRMQHCMMFDRARDEAAARAAARGGEDAEEREIIGLGAAAGEHDLVRLRVQTGSGAFARFVEHAAHALP